MKGAGRYTDQGAADNFRGAPSKTDARPRHHDVSATRTPTFTEERPIANHGDGPAAREAVAGDDVTGGHVLTGYNALVTGGGRGIGAATAMALARAGARVSVAARNEAQVVEIAARLRERHLEAFAFRCDVIDPREVRDLVLSAREAMGRIDILVNCAGTATSNPIEKITLPEWDHIMAVNATGTFLCTQAVWSGMVQRRWGRIVTVASIAGLAGDKYIAAYTAAKHAVVGFTKAAAAEAAGTGVTVNAVCPGYVDTPLTDETIARVMHHTGRGWQEALTSILERAGQTRLIRAEEVAAPIVELCSEGAKDRNGEIVEITGADTP